MRLISTLKDQKQAYTLSLFLQQKGIENQLELTTNKDWGSSEYGDITCNIWIVNEDDLDTALGYANEFINNPNDPKFTTTDNQTPVNVLRDTIEPQSQKSPPIKEVEKPPIGTMTFYILLLCSILMIISNLTSPNVKALAPSIPRIPVLSPQINKDLMYDYPYAYEIIDRLVQTVGIDALADISTLPPSGEKL